MANPLQQGATSPAPPDLAAPQPTMAGQGPNSMQAGPAMPPPAPTHAQAVAGLRHGNAFLDELETLAKNPNLGKTDVKSQIIEGVTKLVAKQFLTAAQAVQELGTVPERPFDQKMWVRNHIQKFFAAQSAILDHHRAAFAGTQDPAIENTMTGNLDNHAADFAGLMGHYKRA